MVCRIVVLHRQEIDQFRQIVWNYYREHGRDLPWRQPEPEGEFDAYKILVSELMLQQTQVTRVIPKYLQFLDAFPTVVSLASASLSEVIMMWNGLGYNRRARFLWQSARMVVTDYKGVVPSDIDELVCLPGIGPNTAAAIATYAYGQRGVFIETNIRTVYIHHFFPVAEAVSDGDLLPFVQQTIDRDNPREWYWALMDYGSMLKTTAGNMSRASRHYVRQSTFEGSVRQLRGKIIRLLTNGPVLRSSIASQLDDMRLLEVLAALEREGLVSQDENYVFLSDGV